MQGGLMPRNHKSQKTMILALLEKGVLVTPMMALNSCGCFRLSAVIFNLRKEGYKIKTNECKNHTGNNYAEYQLT